MKTKRRYSDESEQSQNDKPIESSKSNAWLGWMLATVVLAVLLYFSIFTSGFTSFEGKTSKLISNSVNVQQAGNTAIVFINQNLLQGNATATLNKISDAGDIYKMEVSVNGKNAEVYMSKDAKLLFLQAIDMNQAVPSAQQATLPAQNSPKQSNIQKTATPEVLLFTMAYCPYGNQAEDGIKPVVDLLGNKAKIEPHFVIYSNYRGGGPDYCLDSENKYCSMHGIQELHENVRELIIYRDQPDKYWNYIIAVNTACTSQNVDTCWENVAKTQGIDTERVKAASQTDAVSLLQKEVELNTKYGVQGSPTLIINGVNYNGGRTPDAYKTAICSAFSSTPSECSQTLAGATQTAAPSGGGCAVR